MTTAIEHVPLTDEESNRLVRQCHDGQVARELLDSGEPMDAATERWLRAEVAAGERATERLVAGYSRLVEGLVRERLRVSPAHVDADDLRQAGFEALIRRIPACDPSVRPLHSYVRPFIRRAVADAAAAATGRSSWEHRMRAHLLSARDELTGSLQREPTSTEIGEHAWRTRPELRKATGIRTAGSYAAEVFRSWQRPATVDALELTPDPVDDIEQLFEDVDPTGIRDDVARLPEPVATVIRLRFGLGTGEEPLTPSETARRLGTTVPRVTRLTEEGLATLRRLQLGEHVPPSDLREDLGTETDDLADVVVALPDSGDIEIALAAA